MDLNKRYISPTKFRTYCLSSISLCPPLNHEYTLGIQQGKAEWECMYCFFGNTPYAQYIQFSSVAQSCLTLCDPGDRSTPGLPVHHQLLESTQLMSIESVMPSSHLILCRPLLLLPSIFPSIRVFSNESVLRIRWPKYWSFSFNVSPSNEHPGLISFRMDWLDLQYVNKFKMCFSSETFLFINYTFFPSNKLNGDH